MERIETMTTTQIAALLGASVTHTGTKVRELLEAAILTIRGKLERNSLDDNIELAKEWYPFYQNMRHGSSESQILIGATTANNAAESQNTS